MKKIILSLFLTFSLLILSNVESKGQCSSCPTGTAPTSFKYLVKPGCEIDVYYCWKCPTPPIVPGAAQICYIAIPNTIACTGFMIDATFWENIRVAMVKDIGSKCATPPCSTSASIVVNVTFADCWKVEDNPVLPELTIIEPCDVEPGLCVQMYSVCFDDPEFEVNKLGEPEYIPGACDYEPYIWNPPYPTYCTSSGCPE